MILRMKSKAKPRAVPDLKPDAGPSDQSLRAEIEELRAEVAKLHLALVEASQRPGSDAPWTFDVERDTYGRITEVTASRSSDKSGTLLT